MPASCGDTSVNWLVYWWWPNQSLECWVINPCGALPPIVFTEHGRSYETSKHAVNIFFRGEIVPFNLAFKDATIRRCSIGNQSIYAERLHPVI